MHKTLLCFDFGLNHIGVAIGQTITQSASPLCVLPAKKGQVENKPIQDLITKWRADAFVVGLPLNMDGSEQKITKDVYRFAESLKTHFGLPVYFADERLSTREARSRLFDQGGLKKIQKGRMDAAAAAVILESWFENGLSE